MDDSDTFLQKCINLTNFTAKLWRLANNPSCAAVSWDEHGEVLIINRELFETQIFTPGLMSSESSDSFRTTNFTSLIRQLNLYGFRKVESGDSRGDGEPRSSSYCFKNPYFKRDHPELLRKVVRLTAERKARLKAGLTESQPRYSTPPHSLDQQPPLNYNPGPPALSGTPVPPRYLMRSFNRPFLPVVNQPDKEMSMYLQTQYSRVALNTNNVLFPQALRANQGAPPYTIFNQCNASFYQPGSYLPVCWCNHPYSFGAPSGFIPPQGYYYQGGYPVSEPYLAAPGPSLQQNSETQQQLIKYDVSLETVFQIADEVNQTPPSNTPVKVEVPEAAASVSKPSKATRTRKTGSAAAGKPMKAVDNVKHQERVGAIPQETLDKNVPQVYEAAAKTPELDDSIIYVDSS